MRLDLFSKDDSVLLLGERNFSFSVCLHKHKLPIKIVATCLESDSDIKYRQENIEFLKNNKVPVFLNVDATKLNESACLSKMKFSKVVFNFPHVGGKMKIHLNRELLRKVFESCSNVVTENGMVLVSLCKGQGGTPADEPTRRWDDSWKITEMAAHGDFILTAVEPFLSENFNGYSCSGYRGQDVRFNLSGALVHVFVKSEPPYSSLTESEVFRRMRLVPLSKDSNVLVPVIYSELYQNCPTRNSDSHVSFFKSLLIESFNGMSPDLDWHHLTDEVVPVHLVAGSGVPCQAESGRCVLRSIPFDVCPQLVKFHANFNSKKKITLFPGMYFRPLGMDFAGSSPVEFLFLILGENLLVKMEKFLEVLINLFKDKNVLLRRLEGGSENVFTQGNSFPVSLLAELSYENPDSGHRVPAALLFNVQCEGTSIEVTVVNAQIICQYFFRIGWREIFSGKTHFLVDGKPTSRPISLHASAYDFDITLKYTKCYSEERFYETLWLAAGRLIERVRLVNEYTSTEGWSSRCYRITYRSLELPLHRRRVIEIHSAIVARSLELSLNVTIA